MASIANGPSPGILFLYAGHFLDLNKVKDGRSLRPNEARKAAAGKVELPREHSTHHFLHKRTVPEWGVTQTGGEIG